MKWINHMAIAGATTAVFNPALVPVAVLGSTAPDWFESIANNWFGQNFAHRRETHYLTHWIAAVIFFAFIFDFKHIGLAFAYGGLTHLLTDSLTVSGIPFSPNSNRRFHLFGGRLKTGEPTEYVISGVIIILCFTLINSFGSSGFLPFFFDWAGYYDEGILDAQEWKKSRFKLF